jgi:hypothetical protein
MQKMTSRFTTGLYYLVYFYLKNGGISNLFSVELKLLLNPFPIPELLLA